MAAVMSPATASGSVGPDVGLSQLLGPGALAVQNVAEALHQNVARAQHVRQLAHLLRVGDGLVEGHGEVVRAQNGQVGVVGLQILIRMSVDHGEVVVVVLLADETAGILAEGAHLVLERCGITDQLRFVQHVVDPLHDLVAALHAHADVDGARQMGDVMLGANALQPVRAAASGGDHGAVGVDFPVSLPCLTVTPMHWSPSRIRSLHS